MSSIESTQLPAESASLDEQLAEPGFALDADDAAHAALRIAQHSG